MWGNAGLILRSDDTPVLMRLTRQSPDTRLYAAASSSIVEEIEVAAEPLDIPDPSPSEMPNELPSELPGGSFDEVEPLNAHDVVVSSAAPASGDGDTLTAPPILRGVTRAPQGPPEPAPPPLEVTEPAIEFDLLTDEAETDADSFDLASLPDPTGAAEPELEEVVPQEPPQFSSLAYSGLYTGVGLADGMRLQLSLEDGALNGWFVDSSGQGFRVNGELATNEGRAQAVVISSDTPIGYMDMQLTNLGLTALFVPLSEDMAPITTASRQYEFLRALSRAAQDALEAERVAREEGAENIEPPLGEPSEPDEPLPEGLQEVYPGDEDRGV